MNPIDLDAKRPSGAVTRQKLLTVLNTALESDSFRFARQAALSWLSVYPGDIEVRLMHARILMKENKAGQALSLLEKVCAEDPQCRPAHEALAACPAASPERVLRARLDAYVLGGNANGLSVPDWALNLRKAYDAFSDHKLADAQGFLRNALGVEEDPVLAAILHVALTHELEDAMTTLRLSELYRSRWPDCLAFGLYIADAQMLLGEESSAVAILHQCAANDPAGQVPERIWGREFRYKPLWPAEMRAYFDLMIPIDVAARLGWNMLASGSMSNESVEECEDVHEEQATPAATDEDEKESHENETAVDQQADIPDRPVRKKDEMLRSIEEEFGKLAKHLKKPEAARADGRYPVYVVLSTLAGLKNQYGVQTMEIIQKEMRTLANLLDQRKGWNGLTFYPDDPAVMTALGMEAISAVDPWKIKLALADLDKALGKKGQMIGALLIVGGPEVVPFHRLPNPTDDLDAEVLSDNPYATLDSNYFVPEWPVGRLVGESGPDAGLLLEQLRCLIRYHSKLAGKIKWWEQMPRPEDLWPMIRNWFKGGNTQSFGYTAAIWQRSSLAAFRPIGQGRSLRVSPPDHSGSVNGHKVLSAQMTYFNLHGVMDGPDWYGQKDANDAADGPDYPVAISPAQIKKNGRAPEAVFTEACYGAYILNKSENESMALKLISVGTQVLVGSTCIAYGSITTPLIGADLLGYLFWKFMREGNTAGDAFLQAKVALVREMNRRQGYLDGEDQKTLISFVLYGDPLMALKPRKAAGKGFLRQRSHLMVKTICDRGDGDQPERIPLETLKEVKQIVENYLPGIENAEVRVSKQHATCDSTNHSCPTGTLGTKVRHPAQVNHTVVTFSKQVQGAQFRQVHYARVTLDNNGKMVKLAVSR